MIAQSFTLLLGSLFLFQLMGPVAGRASDLASPENVATNCCRAGGGDIQQHLKAADRLYAQFKPKEASNELQKVLQAEPNNVEAILKLCRAHIDIGDMIPESSQNSKERRLNEYSAAEDYARKAVALSPTSTWSYFYLAASLGNIAVLSPRDKQIE